MVGDAVAGVAPAIDRRGVDGGELKTQALRLGLNQTVGFEHGLKVRRHAGQTCGRVRLANLAAHRLKHLVGGDVDQPTDRCFLQRAEETAKQLTQAPAAVDNSGKPAA